MPLLAGALFMQLRLVVVHGLTIVVQIVVMVLDGMGPLVLGLGISREPDQSRDCQRHHCMLHHCPLLRKEVYAAGEPLSSDQRPRTVEIRLGSHRSAAGKSKIRRCFPIETLVLVPTSGRNAGGHKTAKTGNRHR